MLATPAQRDAIVQGAVARAQHLLSGFAGRPRDGSRRRTPMPCCSMVSKRPTGMKPGIRGSGDVDNDPMAASRYLLANHSQYPWPCRTELLSAALNEHPVGMGRRLPRSLPRWDRLHVGSAAHQHPGARRSLMSSGTNWASLHARHRRNGNLRIIALPGAESDIMAQGEDPFGLKTYSVTANAMNVALGLNWTLQAARTGSQLLRRVLQGGRQFRRRGRRAFGHLGQPDAVQGTGGLDRHRADQAFVSDAARPGLGLRGRDRRAESVSKLPHRESRRPAARDRRAATPE